MCAATSNTYLMYLLLIVVLEQRIPGARYVCTAVLYIWYWYCLTTYYYSIHVFRASSILLVLRNSRQVFTFSALYSVLVCSHIARKLQGTVRCAFSKHPTAPHRKRKKNRREKPYKNRGHTEYWNYSQIPPARNPSWPWQDTVNTYCTLMYCTCAGTRGNIAALISEKAQEIRQAHFDPWPLYIRRWLR